MIGPSGSKGRPGAAAGLPGPPPRAMASFCSNIGRLTATGRVADAPIPASPGRSGLCLRNPVTLIDGAMHWAADHDGSPLADVCEGNPGRLFSGQGYVPVSMACSAWLLPRTRRRRHEALRLQGQPAVDQSERNLGRRNAGNDGRVNRSKPLPDLALAGAAVAVGTSEKREVKGVSSLAPLLTPVVNNGLDVDGVQVTRPAARPCRSFRFLHYSSRDLKSHWRSPRAASLKPLDIPAAVTVIKRAAALACHRFVTMEWIVSTGEPVARSTS